MPVIHVGNLNLGHSLQQNHKKINGIIFGGEAAKYQSQRIKALHKANIELIPVSDNLSSVYHKEALDKGEIVSSLATVYTAAQNTILLIFQDLRQLFRLEYFALPLN